MSCLKCVKPVSRKQLDWDTYFLDITKSVATRSTCLRVPSGVGAVLVLDRQILSTGYCGSIKGTEHCTEVGCLIDEVTGGCVRTVHAEINALIQAARPVKGATCYCSMSPCWDCFKALANAGVTRMVYAVEYRIIERQKMFAAQCGIKFEHLGTGVYTGSTKKKEER